MKAFKYLVFFLILVIIASPFGIWFIFTQTNIPSKVIVYAIERHYFYEDFHGDLTKGFLVKGLFKKKEIKMIGVKSVEEMQVKYHFDFEDKELEIESLSIFDVRGYGSFADLKKIFFEVLDNMRNSLAEVKEKESIAIEFDEINLSKWEFKNKENDEVTFIEKLKIKDWKPTAHILDFDFFELESNFLNLKIYRKKDSTYVFQGDLFPVFVPILKDKFPIYGKIEFSEKNSYRIKELLVGFFKENGVFRMDKSESGELKVDLKVSNVSFQEYFDIKKEIIFKDITTVPTLSLDEILVKDSNIIIDGEEFFTRKISFKPYEVKMIFLPKEEENRNEDDERNYTLRLSLEDGLLLGNH